MIGFPATLSLFRRSMFSVTMGSNDFINNYLAPAVLIYEQQLASPEIFVNTLVSKFREQLIVMLLIQDIVSQYFILLIFL